jgi:hypothetical protein
MTTTKTPSSKNSKSAKKTDRKKSRKVTIDYIWKIIEEIKKPKKRHSA